ncbi:MAG: thioredoxin-disulfide reductase [bacterium]
MKEINYDIAILGGGPAGLSAAVYAARGASKTCIVDTGMFGGQVSNTLEIENYPGFSTIGGFDLMEKFEEHADSFGIDKHAMQEIEKIDLVGTTKKIYTKEFLINAKTIIIACGAQPTKLNLDKEKELTGRGVSYCAVCDGAFFRDKEVTVVGGGNAAVEEALYLTKFASKVNLVHRRDKLRADKIYQERAFANPKINFIWNTVVTEIIGEEKLSAITIKDVLKNEEYNLNTEGLFPYVGYTPNTSLFADKILLDKAGFIITDSEMQTSIKGVYAAGDIRVTPLRQVITAAADGAVAATSAIKYLEEVESEVKV